MFRPKKCMKCGGKHKMQLAGEVQCPPGFKSDGFGNCIPDEPQKFNTTNYAKLPSEKINIPLQPLIKEEDVVGPPPINEPVNQPVYKDRIDEGIAKGIISGKKDEDGNEGNARDQYNAIHEEKDKEPQPKLDPYWLFRGFRNGMSWLSGMVERGRQNRYDWMQQTALGQMNPMPTDDFQPNPYNLYMQKGGNLKHIVKEYNKYTNAAQMDMGDGMVDDQGLMKKGGHVSIVELLAERGQDASFDARKKMFDKYFDGKYSGTAEQNIAMIKMLENPVKDSPFVGARAKAPTKNEQAPRKQVAPSPAKKVEQVKKDTPKSTAFANAIGAAVATISGDRRGTLESGVVVDKGTNTEYVIKGNKIVKSFPVLTGKSGKNPKTDPNSNPFSVDYLESHPEARSTPTGSYLMNPNPNIYGWPGYNLQGIPAYGESAQKTTVAMHITYGSDPKAGLKGHPDQQEFKRRNAAYNMPSQNRYMSYGCTNMQGEAIDCLTKEFPKGDTAVYIDSRIPKDKDLIRSFQKEEGGEMKKGGYEIDRMIITRKILPQLLQLGRLGTSKYRRMKAGGLTPNKARQILHDKEVHGKPLTDKQRRYFGAMSKGHTNFRGK